jgi:2-isopropylmalate synthase
MDFALEVCEEVLNVLKPTQEKKAIVNLPATVEMSTPNVFADQIEWFSNHLSCRDNTIISIHAHNDRGTGVATTELAMLAGADRVEGTLFCNGERTGNADILTLAMNLYSRGIDPELTISDINHIKDVYEACTEMTVNQRHPYAGELVYTAFSGSHQDAIRKGLKSYNEENLEYWEVPYLPIDPSDIGREYEPIIRINSQSGKGGVAFIMEENFGYQLPKSMHPEFGMIIKKATDDIGRELSPEEIMEQFEKTYFDVEKTVTLSKYSVTSTNGDVTIDAKLTNSGGKVLEVVGTGNGPISAFFRGLKKFGYDDVVFKTYEEHALTSGVDAEAVAYIELIKGDDVYFGVGQDKNTTTASLRAILCAINRMKKAENY